MLCLVPHVALCAATAQLLLLLHFLPTLLLLPAQLQWLLPCLQPLVGWPGRESLMSTFPAALRTFVGTLATAGSTGIVMNVKTLTAAAKAVAWDSQNLA